MTEIASKLAHAIAQGTAAHQQHAAEEGPERRRDEIHSLLENWEHELAQMFRERGMFDVSGPMFTDELRQAFGSLTEPTHQMDFFFSILGVMGLMLTGGAAASEGWASQLRNAALRTHGDIQPDIGAVAQGIVQGIKVGDEGYKAAKVVGYSQGNTDFLAELAQQWPSFEPLMTLWQRNVIPESYVDLVLRRQGFSVANISELKHLRYGPPSAAFAAQARTQNQLTDAEYHELLQLNGIDVKYANAIYETEGQTMPPMMANELFRRGYIDVAKYEEILIESNLKNKYVPLLKDLRWRVPPMRQTIAAFHNGSIDRVMAEDRLSKLGFDVIDREWMLNSASKSTGSAGKHLSMQQHLAAYEAQLESRQDAEAALVAIGWAPADVELEFDVADHRATLARTSRAANAIGTRYVGWKIDRHTAGIALDALQLPAPARDEALAAWDIEREAKMHHPSLADMKAMHKAGWMTTEEVRAELFETGYRPDLAERYIQTFFGVKK